MYAHVNSGIVPFGVQLFSPLFTNGQLLSFGLGKGKKLQREKSLVTVKTSLSAVWGRPVWIFVADTNPKMFSKACLE